MRFRAVQGVLPSYAISNEEVLGRIEEESRSLLSPGELRRVLRMTRFAFRSMGTTVRYRRDQGELAYELAARAGRSALARAGMEPGEIDLLIYVGVGRGFLEPATANVFHDLLGLDGATCFDILDACASWLRALQVARSFLAAGTYRNIMILNAEFNANLESYEIRSVDDFDHRFPAFTVGEAATATIVSESERDDEEFTEFRSYGDQRDLCLIPLENWRDYLATEREGLEPMRFFSLGSDIMEFGLSRLVEQYRANEEFQRHEPDIVFFHSASDGMSREGLKQCGIEEEKGFYAHQRFANTVSASVPLAMATAAEEGQLREGMRVLLAVASAGITTAWSRFIYLR